MPVYSPSSLVDFGAAGAGRGFLLFDTPDPPARVRDWLDRELAARGWAPGGPPGTGFYRRGERRLEVRLEELRPGTRLRVEYPRRRGPASG